MMSSQFVYSISDCLQTAADLFECARKRKNQISGIIQNREEIPHEHTVTPLHNGIISGPFQFTGKETQLRNHCKNILG